MTPFGQALSAAPGGTMQPAPLGVGVDFQRQLPERHARIGEMLARDAAAWQIVPSSDARPTHPRLQLHAHRDGPDLRWIELSLNLRITPEELARAMLVRLDEALGLEGTLQQQTAWLAEDESGLADLAISVAERIQGSCGDAGELDNEVDRAVVASNHGVQGVACYLIERLGIGEAFDALAQFARERFVDRLHAAEREHA